ncbi:unnamed protein product [Orchesella dallaii]|uniref:F-box domain-containing protein n=1 Tax=Orchesella dallaii TaxID=48710 RepID=A0ABP1QLM4_9HEXA
MASIDVLPNELLCKILDTLSTEQKFRAREVCRRWKDVVDELVPFYGVQLCDEKYDQVSTRFGTRRVSSLKFTCGHVYSRHSIIPIQNLSFLKRLVLTKSMNVDALTDLITRADKLIEMEIWNGYDSDWYDKQQTAVLLPALRKVKKLLLPKYEHGNQVMLFHSWKHIIQREMPELQHFEIDVSLENLFHPRFYWLATLKPNLREFMVQNVGRDVGFSPYVRVTTIWNVNGQSRDSEGLRKFNFINAPSSVLIHETPQWETILFNQNNLEELQLYDLVVPRPGKGYSMSLIEPVLTKSMATLHTIRLDIGAERIRASDDFDMEIFAKLATLRELHLSVRVVKFQAIFGNGINFLRGIKNCSTVISATLCKLVLHGFMFSTEEANDCIKQIAKLDLEKVVLFRGSTPEISTVWKGFSRRARKMGLKKEARVKTLYLPVEFAGIEFEFEHKKTSTC